jgi:hypothetical protein
MFCYSRKIKAMLVNKVPQEQSPSICFRVSLSLRHACTSTSNFQLALPHLLPPNTAHNGSHRSPLRMGLGSHSNAHRIRQVLSNLDTLPH